MTNRLKVILVVGIIAIAATWLLTRTPDTSNDDAAYQQQLAEIREKQAQRIAEAKQEQTETNSSPAPTAETGKPSDAAANPNLAEHVTNNLQNTIQSLQNLMPSKQQQPVANYDANDKERLQYLQSMPVTVIEATRRQDALAMARTEAGRVDPFEGLANSQPFPKQRKNAVGKGGASLEALAGTKSGADMGSGPDGLPPPPPDTTLPGMPGELPPPPPPTPDPLPGISISELPPPPEKPLLSKKLKLNAIVGDRVIFTVRDKNFQRKHHLQKYITLAQGQEFDSVTLVGIGSDKATLEENGRQITMELDPIR